MYWKQYIFIFFLTLTITGLEILIGYHKNRGYLTAYKSKFAIFLFLFNIIVGYSLFFLNTDGGVKFLNITNPWVLALLTGSSGFLFINSKIDFKKIVKNYEWLGLKSIFSGIKSILHMELNNYIEVDYPIQLTDFICENFCYENVEKYAKYVQRLVKRFTKSDDQKKAELFDLIESFNRIEGNSKEDIVDFYTEMLFEIRDPCWIKKNILPKFCNKEIK